MPRDLERIIARCLRKDLTRRFQHIGDVKVALEELKEESDSGHLTAPGVGSGEEKGARLDRCGGRHSARFRRCVDVTFPHAV
jgi:hypothetical protein